MSREDDLLIVDYVHEDEAKGQRFTDLAPVRLTFNLSEDVPDLPPDIHFGTGGVELTRGRLRDSLRLITTDPEEDRASRHLHQRLSWTMHPDMDKVAAAMGRMKIGRASCRERVSVRVDLGGSRMLQKKNNTKQKKSR